LRQAFGTDTELDELEAAVCRGDTVRGHGRHKPWRENGPNPGSMVGAAQVSDPGEVEWHIEDTNREDWQNGFITLTDCVYMCTKIELNYVC